MKVHKISSLFFSTVSFLTIFLLEGSAGLKDVRLSLPTFVVQGQEMAILSCKYDLEYDSLYALKLYKGNKEFYRFVPKEVPAQKVFPLFGVQVDVLNSNANNITLRNLSLDSSGQYFCVVSAESSFQTLQDSGKLIVVVIGDDSRPVLQLNSKHFHPGDTIQGTCYAPPSIPEANITFYLNERQVDPEMQKTEIRHNPVNPLQKITVSSISFELPGNLHPFRIRCQANIFTAYDQFSWFTINPIARRLSGPDTLLRSGSANNQLRLFYYYLKSNLAQLVICTTLIRFLVGC